MHSDSSPASLSGCFSSTLGCKMSLCSTAGKAKLVLSGFLLLFSKVRTQSSDHPHTMNELRIITRAPGSPSVSIAESLDFDWLGTWRNVTYCVQLHAPLIDAVNLDFFGRRLCAEKMREIDLASWWGSQTECWGLLHTTTTSLLTLHSCKNASQLKRRR